MTAEELENIEEGMRVQLALNKSEEKQDEKKSFEDITESKKKKCWIVRMFEKLFKRKSSD